MEEIVFLLIFENFKLLKKWISTSAQGSRTNFELKSATGLPTSLFIPEKKKKKFGTYEFQSELGKLSAESALPKVGRPCRLLQKQGFLKNSANHLPSSTVLRLPPDSSQIQFFFKISILSFDRCAGDWSEWSDRNERRIRIYPMGSGA